MTIFFILSSLSILSSILLITNKNPVYSVLNLVLLFVCGSLLLLILGLDFLPFVFIIVYVGAVAVLFLFVVIILDIKLSSCDANNNKREIFFILVIWFSTCIILSFLDSGNTNILENYGDFYKFGPILGICDFYELDKASCLRDFGNVLYVDYIEHVVIGGFVLLVAIIGAVVLTSRRRQFSLKQKIFKQSERFSSVGKTYL